MSQKRQIDQCPPDLQYTFGNTILLNVVIIDYNTDLSCSYSQPCALRNWREDKSQDSMEVTGNRFKEGTGTLGWSYLTFLIHSHVVKRIPEHGVIAIAGGTFDLLLSWSLENIGVYA